MVTTLRFGLRRLLSAAAIMLALGGVASGQTLHLKLGHILPPDSPEQQAFVFMADKVKEYSGGTMAIDIFPASQLGSEPTMLESVQTGSLDMMVELLEWYGNWDKRFGVFGLPYVFRDRAHFNKFLATDQFRKMLAELGEKRNIVFINPDHINWQLMSDRTLLSRRPIFTPEDLKGIKLRMFEARVPVLAWQTLGANTVIIPWAQTYSALATGTVEAVTARIEAHYQMKQTEVAKFLTVTEEYYQIYIPLLSAERAKQLTPQQMQIISRAAREAGDYFTKLTTDITGEMIHKVRGEQGVAVIYPPLGPWQATMKPAIVKLESEGVVPKDIVDDIQALH